MKDITDVQYENIEDVKDCFSDRKPKIETISRDLADEDRIEAEITISGDKISIFPIGEIQKLDIESMDIQTKNKLKIHSEYNGKDYVITIRCREVEN